MNWSLLDSRGQRKYLTSVERKGFVVAALKLPPQKASFCLTLALTGARISEVLALTASSIDKESGTIAIETLKRRRDGVFRAVPVPRELIALLSSVHHLEGSPPEAHLWSFSRPSAWKYVKDAMAKAGVVANVAKPKAPLPWKRCGNELH
jgi:integrase